MDTCLSVLSIHTYLLSCALIQQQIAVETCWLNNNRKWWKNEKNNKNLIPYRSHVCGRICAYLKGGSGFQNHILIISYCLPNVCMTFLPLMELLVWNSTFWSSFSGGNWVMFVLALVPLCSYLEWCSIILTTLYGTLRGVVTLNNAHCQLNTPPWT